MAGPIGTLENYYNRYMGWHGGFMGGGHYGRGSWTSMTGHVLKKALRPSTRWRFKYKDRYWGNPTNRLVLSLLKKTPKSLRRPVYRYADKAYDVFLTEAMRRLLRKGKREYPTNGGSRMARFFPRRRRYWSFRPRRRSYSRYGRRRYYG